MAWPRPVRPRRLATWRRIHGCFATEPPEFSLEDRFPSASCQSKPWDRAGLGIGQALESGRPCDRAGFGIEQVLGSRMTRTMWIALFCLVGLGPAIAIRVVTRPASLAVEADQSRTELAPAPNEAAKADRLPLHDIRAETEVMPAVQPEPPETPAAGPDGTVKIPGRRWRDANARALPGETLPRTGSGVDTGDENTSNSEPEPPS